MNSTQSDTSGRWCSTCSKRKAINGTSFCRLHGGSDEGNTGIKKKRNIRDTSKSQERVIAERYRQSGFPNASRVPGSGAFASLPGDIDPKEFLLVEAKQTRSGRMTLDPKWVHKVKIDAAELGRPWWAIHMWCGDDTGPYEKVVVITEDFFMSLLKEINQYRKQ